MIFRFNRTKSASDVSTNRPITTPHMLENGISTALIAPDLYYLVNVMAGIIGWAQILNTIIAGRVLQIAMETKKTWKGFDAESQTDDVIDYLKNRDSENPFCMFLSWGPPHHPYREAPQDYLDRYDPKTIQGRPNCPDCSGRRPLGILCTNHVSR